MKSINLDWSFEANFINWSVKCVALYGKDVNEANYSNVLKFPFTALREKPSMPTFELLCVILFAACRAAPYFVSFTCNILQYIILGARLWRNRTDYRARKWEVTDYENSHFLPCRRRRSANVIIMARQVGRSSVSKLPKIKDSLVRERMDLPLLSVGIPRFSPWLNPREIMGHARGKQKIPRDKIALHFGCRGH